jgi:intracellular septation protein
MSEIEKKPTQLQKLALDLGPLGAFALANAKWGLLTATGVLMAGTFVSLVAGYWLTRKWNKFTLVSALFVGVFGAITLYMQDTFYLKLKVSVVEALFAALLLGGLWFKRLFVKDLMGEVLEMPDEAWRTLTWRWSGFFIFMALANIVVWQMFSDTVWVNFKAFGIMAATVIFAFANAPFMAKHLKDEG